MPQQYYTQSGADASIIASMIEELGKDVGKGMQTAMAMRLRNREIDLQSLDKIKTFMSLPAEKRKALLQDPSFRQNIIQTLDPEAFRSKKSAKNMAPDVYQQKVASALSLGEETESEKAAREKEVQQAAEAKAKTRTEQAAAIIAEQKARISTGLESPTPMSLLMTGDVKDPIAAALFSLIPQNELKTIAEAQHKVGPLYQQQQMQEWYKWGVSEGMPLGVAMQTAISISRGEWDKVPASYTDATSGKTIPVRGKAEQQLALDTMNTRAKMQEVNNNIQNSIASGAAQLAEKAGIPLDQARANIMALREGKPTPFPTPNIEAMVNIDRTIKQQEVTKNQQTIMNDQAGIGVIKEALNSMISTYKESGMLTGVLSNAQRADLEDKIAKTQEELTARLAGRYGIKYETYDANHPFSSSVRGAMGATWGGMKAAGAMGIDLTSDAGKLLDDAISSTTTTPRADFIAPVVNPRTFGLSKFTPDQENIFKNLVDSLNTALGSDSVPAEQKEAMRKYVTDTLKPIYDNPSRFLELFKQPEPQQEQQQEF